MRCNKVSVAKWTSATIIPIAMVFHVMGWTPWNSILQIFGAAGWVYVGTKTGERALLLNSFLSSLL